jgi:hypothetical protein
LPAFDGFLIDQSGLGQVACLPFDVAKLAFHDKNKIPAVETPEKLQPFTKDFFRRLVVSAYTFVHAHAEVQHAHLE